MPGLGLKRGLADDLVIAPYASVMALMVAPEEACVNLQRMAAEGSAGKYGMYEAVDYTPSRLPRGRSSAVIRSFMAHHQGMSLLSLAYLLLDRPMQKRFEADPAFPGHHIAAAGENSQGRPVPCAAGGTFRSAPGLIGSGHTDSRHHTTRIQPVPEVQLLSNGRYHVMITNAGAGTAAGKILRSRDGAKTPRATTGAHSVTSAMWTSDRYGQLHISRRWNGRINTKPSFPMRRWNSAGAISIIDTHTEIAVSPEDDIELRRNQDLQSHADPQDDRGHQLCRSSARVSRCRRVASRLQQSVCADGDFLARGKRFCAIAGLAPSMIRRRGCFT